MIIAGTIGASGQFLSVTPRAGDQVLVFGADDGHLAGAGLVGRDGDFQAIVTRTASFNGNPLVIELQQGLRRYALLRLDGGAPAWLRFAGRLMPERIALQLQVGPQTAELHPDQAALPQAQRLTRRPELPCDIQADVNEDGRCDEADWQILNLFGGGVSRTVGRP